MSYVIRVIPEFCETLANLLTSNFLTALSQNPLHSVSVEKGLETLEESK